MSHAGSVYLENKDIPVAYFDYDGYRACSKLYPDGESCFNRWGTEFGTLTEAKCICDEKPTYATLHADYGNGVSWEAPICLNCMCIISNHDPYAWQKDYSDNKIGGGR